MIYDNKYVNEATPKVLSSFNVNGEQLTFVGEAELAELRMKAAWCDKYYHNIMDAASLLYPDVDIWADTGNGFSISLNIFTRMETDLFKFLNQPKPVQAIQKKGWFSFGNKNNRS